MQTPSTPKKQPPSYPLGGPVRQTPERAPGSVIRVLKKKKAPTRRGGTGAGPIVIGATLQDEENDNMATLVTVEENDGTPETAAKKPKKPAEIAMEKFAYELARKKIDGLKAEFKELQAFKPTGVTATSFAMNKNRNRYNNVLCYDHTRVILTHNVPPSTDYINANWVSSSLVGLTNKYICTQGPTDFTVNDFWRMIWQEKVKSIVMLCGVFEGGKPKCAQYYPTKPNESKTYGTVQVTNKRNTTASGEKIYESTLFEVIADGFAEPIQLTLMRWLDWPDFGIPQSGLGMLRIMKFIRANKHSTAVIHCSAGIGRTGTVMACEICLRIMLEGKELNVPEVVKELRCQRAGSIQTESQYIYLHRALSEYVHAKKLVKDELSKFFLAFAEYRKLLIKQAENSTPASIARAAPPGAFPKPS
jgi:protein tyrosine phosphatase